MLARLRSLPAAPLVLCALALLPRPEPGATTLAGVPSLCLFRLATGLPCPVCGLTRSLVCCAHGAFADSLAFHPLGVFAFAALLWLSARCLPWLRLPRPGDAALAWAAGIGLGALVGVWAARLLGAAP